MINGATRDRATWLFVSVKHEGDDVCFSGRFEPCALVWPSCGSHVGFYVLRFLYVFFFFSRMLLMEVRLYLICGSCAVDVTFTDLLL